MRWLARLLVCWMPAAVKLRACRDVSADFTALLSGKLASTAGGRDAFRAAAYEAGLRAGKRLRDRLALGDSPDDVLLAWKIVAKASGMKFTVEKAPGKSIFRHLSCPVLSSGGARLCEDFCLPMVRGLTAAVCPSCAVEIIDPASGARPCVKALVKPVVPDAH